MLQKRIYIEVESSYKFLIDKEGKVIKRYAPTTKPLKIKDDIIQLLKQ